MAGGATPMATKSVCNNDPSADSYPPHWFEATTKSQRTPSPVKISLRACLAVTTNPLFVIAVITLVANDHYLKANFANTLTGKLSDVAGLAVLAILTTAIARSLAKNERPALLAMSLLFGSIKTFTGLTNIVVDFLDTLLPWSNAIVTDPTDLFTLLVIPIAARAATPDNGAFAPGLAGTRRNLTNLFANWNVLPRGHLELGQTKRTSLSPLQVSMLALTAFACAATSSEEPGELSLGLGHTGVVVAGTRSVEYAERQAKPEFDEAQRADEAPTSEAVDPSAVTVTAELVSPGSGPIQVDVALTAFDRTPKMQACVPAADDHCFRIADTGQVYETIDGGATWETIWSISTTSVATRNHYYYYSETGDDVFVPQDIEVAENGTFVVLLSGAEYTSRSLDGVWILPDSTFREISRLFIVQAALGFLALAVAASTGLSILRPGKALLLSCIAAVTLLCLYGGYYETYVVFPLASVAAVFFLVVTTIAAVGLSQTSKLGPNPTVGFVAAVPSIGTMISSVPVVVWSEYNVATFEDAAILQFVLVVIMSIGLYLWSHLTTRTVALPSSVSPAPGPATP